MSNPHDDIETSLIKRIEFTLEEIQTMQRAVSKLLTLWKLTDDQATTLLGRISISELHDWQKKQSGSVKPEVSVRMSYLIGIRRYLRILFHDQKRCHTWINKPNTAFEGQSALDLMLRGRLEDIAFVRRYLSAVVAS